MKTQISPRTMTRRFRLLGIFAAVTVVAVVIVAAVSAQKDNPMKKKEAVSKKTPASVPPTQLAVSTDPVTGQIRPLTKDESQKLADALKQMVNQSSEGLREERHDDGSVSVNLEGRFQNVSVARKNADGSVDQACVNDTRSAAGFFGIDSKYFGDKPRRDMKPKALEESDR